MEKDNKAFHILGAIFVKDLRWKTWGSVERLCPEFQRWRCSRNRKIEHRARSKISNLRRSMEHDAPLSPNKASKSVPYETTPDALGRTEAFLISIPSKEFYRWMRIRFKKRQCKLRSTIPDFPFPCKMCILCKSIILFCLLDKLKNAGTVLKIIKILEKCR